MPNTELVDTNVREVIRQRLGASGVDVELKDDDFDKAFQDALRHYNRARPFRGHAQLPVSRSQKKYGPIDDLHVGFQGAMNAKFLTRAQYQDQELDPFDPEDNNNIGVNGQNTYGDYALSLAYQEDARRVIGAEPEALMQWEPDGHFYIYASVHKDGTLCGYEYTSHYVWKLSTDSAVAAKQIPATMIPDGDVDWVLDFATARAKQVLGSIRGKFEGIPTPEGGNDPVDYSKLTQEGRDDEKELLEMLKRRRRPLPPVMG